MLCVGKSKKLKNAMSATGTDWRLTRALIRKINEGDEAGVMDLINVSVLQYH